MSNTGAGAAERKYDRDFLLSQEMRNQIAELWEIEKYGLDCFGDPNHVHLYGMPPREWYQRGVRILARTCLEAVKDQLGNKIGSDVAEVVSRATGPPRSASSIRSPAHATGSTRCYAICRDRRASASNWTLGCLS